MWRQSHNVRQLRVGRKSPARAPGTTSRKVVGQCTKPILARADQQVSALQHFREEARILVCTSVGEEGLDIPTADIEVWIDPPGNPRKWIQRFGRILRQPGDKNLAKTYAPISMGTHEKKRLLSVKRKVEQIYGFTQRMETRRAETLPSGQKTLAEYLWR